MYLFSIITRLNMRFSFLPFASLVSLKRYLCFYFAFPWLLTKLSIFHMFKAFYMRPLLGNALWVCLELGF